MNILEKMYRRAMRQVRYGARGRVDTRMAAPLLGGVGLGAGLMYVMDPSRGTRRRALVRDKLSHVSRAAGTLFYKGSRELRDRSRGALIETKTHLQNEQVPDALLLERVRARLGHATSHPRAIEVETQDGYVTLRGPVLAADVGEQAVVDVAGFDVAVEEHHGAGREQLGEPLCRLGAIALVGTVGRDALGCVDADQTDVVLGAAHRHHDRVAVDDPDDDRLAR